MAAFVMVINKEDKQPLTVANWSPGKKTDQFAYRSELTGVDSILSALAILVKHFNIKNRQITISLAFSSALKTCLPIKPLGVKILSFDFLQDIRNRLDMPPLAVTWRWVEGHQKEKGKIMGWLAS